MKTIKTSHFGMRHLVLALSVLACAAPAMQAQAASSWMGGEHVQGNNAIQKQAREVGHFSGLSMGLPGNVELRIGSTEAVSIETDGNLLPLIETVVENGTLKIRATKKNLSLEPHVLKIIVQAKDMDRLALGGSGSIESDALRGAKLQFDLGGSGSINVKGIDGESVAVTVGGSGNLKAGSGSTKSLSVSIGGSGDVNLGQLKSVEASVSVAGSGQATIAVRDTLSVTIAGSGDVNYYGDPKVSKTVVGSGGAKRLGGAR
ncbi:MAG: head GIN domain-containing protein [Pseudomonadota bacterium]